MTLFFLNIYFIIGLIMSMGMTYLVFDKDFDGFVYDQNLPPLGVKEKIGMILTTIILWPLYLYWVFNHE